MLSKIKLLVDYPCHVYLDETMVGDAIENVPFILQLRRGQYRFRFESNWNWADRENKQYHAVKNVVRELSIDEDGTDYLIHIELTKRFNIQVLPESINDIFRGYDYDYCKHIDAVIQGDFINPLRLITNKSIEVTVPKDCDTIRFRVSFKRRNQDKIADKWLYLPFNSIIVIDIFYLNVSSIFFDKPQLLLYQGLYVYVITLETHDVVKVRTRPYRGCLYDCSYDQLLIYDPLTNKFGLYDYNDDNVVLPPVYEEIFNAYSYSTYNEEEKSFNIMDNSYIFRSSHLYGILGKDGSVKIPAKYDSAYLTRWGYIVRCNNKWALLEFENDKKSNRQRWFDDIFSLKLASRSVHDDIEYIETHADSWFHCSCLLFCRNGEKYGFWDCNHAFHEPSFDKIVYSDCCENELSASLIRVNNDSLWGAIDSCGNIIYDCIFDHCEFYKRIINNYSYRRYQVLIVGSKGIYGAFDVKGDIIAPFEFKTSKEVSDYLHQLSL